MNAYANRPGVDRATALYIVGLQCSVSKGGSVQDLFCFTRLKASKMRWRRVFLWMLYVAWSVCLCVCLSVGQTGAQSVARLHVPFKNFASLFACKVSQ